MAITIDSAFIQEYSDNVRQLSQQGESRLRPKVYEVSSGGEFYNFDRLAESEAIQKVDRRVDTEYVDDEWSRRVATPKTFTHTMTVEHEDKVQMLASAESEYAINQAMAMKREYDDLIIEAATADALDGDGNLIPIDPAQIIGDGTTPISFDFVTAIQEQYMVNEIMPDEEKCMVVSPKQVRKLMQLTEQTSSDYVNAQALQTLNSTGIVLNWMGFDWVISNRLEAPAIDELYCLSFTKKAIGLAVNQDIFTRIGENPAKSYMIQVFSQWTAGAVRVEDEHIVVGHVADTL